MTINSKKLPFVSVIIPTYNDWLRLRKCLLALSMQTYPQKRFEVIVINNNPYDSIPENIQSFNYVFLTEKKVGSYAARNLGISFSKGKILAFTDSDCIPDPRWIELAVNRFYRGIERLAGNVDIFPMSVNPNIAELYDMTFGFDQELSAEIGLSVTANMFATSSLFEKFGKFDSSMFSGGDTEWSRRLFSNGISINYAPEVIVKHPARRSLKELFKKRLRVSAKKTMSYDNSKKNQISKLKIYKKRMHYLLYGKYSLYMMVGVLIVAILLKFFSHLVKIFCKLKM